MSLLQPFFFWWEFIWSVFDKESFHLVSTGLDLIRLLSCLSFGRVSLGDIAKLIFGNLCLIAWYGVFDVKGMLEALRDVNVLH